MILVCTAVNFVITSSHFFTSSLLLSGLPSFFINPLIEGEEEEIEVKMKKVSYFITAISNKSIDFRKASGGTSHTLSIGTLKKMYLAESVLEIQGLASYYTPLLNELLNLVQISNLLLDQLLTQDHM